MTQRACVRAYVPFCLHMVETVGNSGERRELASQAVSAADRSAAHSSYWLKHVLKRNGSGLKFTAGTHFYYRKMCEVFVSD